MTRRTTQLFRRIMIRMTEPDTICRRLLRRAHQTSELMTSATRRDVSSVCLCIRRVTAKTSDMSVQPRRNRERNATTVSPVTTGTSSTRSSVLRMIEPGVETAQRWKRFDLSALRIRVTDRADLARGI